ncbi:MAG TPA: hypothetical protein VLB27_07690 [candidate division Zixibacteria bacterium]|nr:hypothetical protein [candidate division Zixibacteria bacterium]
MDLNLAAGWIGILLGMVSGAVQGLFFHEETWLGGYNSWRRRIIRLGHISFFGIGFINITYALSRQWLQLGTSTLETTLLLIGALGMPLICYLSALKKSLRHLFPLPVVSLLLAVALFLHRSLVL